MGFFGIGNFCKAGSGVSKDAPEKKAFFRLIDMITLRFGKLISQSLIYLLFCVPAIIFCCVGYYACIMLIPINNDMLFELCVSVVLAISFGLTGPANAASTKISRYYMENKLVMLFSDFYDAFKQNIKQGLQLGMFNATCLLLFYHSTIFYIDKINNEGGIIYIVSLTVVLCISIILLFISYYSYLLIVSISLPFITILKNSFIFSSMGFKSNIVITLYNIIIMVPILLYFPLTIFSLLILPAINSLVIVFNTYPYIYEYSIKPYYENNNLENPYEKEKDEENISIFED